MQLEPEKKRMLLRSAEELASELADGGATRSEWRPVINALYLVPGEPEQRLKAAEELVEALPDSWLRERSNKTRRQLQQVRSTFRRILRESYSEPELRFLLGWTTRILDADLKEERRLARSQTGKLKKPKKPEPRASQRETWPRATVSYNAGGGGILCAVAADRRTAEARQEAARKLIETLGDEARTRIVKRRKSLRADVDVVKVGVSWKLVAVRHEK